MRARGFLVAFFLAASVLLAPHASRLALAAPPAAAPAAAQTPEALVKDVYQHYLETAPDTVVGFDFADPNVAKSYFDPLLAKLVAADAKADEPKLNFDPFIDGQDFEIKAVTYTTKLSTKTSAVVVAEFENYDEKKIITFKLVRTAAGWRIADVQWGGNPQTLRLMLGKPSR